MLKGLYLQTIYDIEKKISSNKNTAHDIKSKIYTNKNRSLFTGHSRWTTLQLVQRIWPPRNVVDDVISLELWLPCLICLHYASRIGPLKYPCRYKVIAQALAPTVQELKQFFTGAQLVNTPTM